MKALLPRLFTVLIFIVGVIHVDVNAQNESEIKVIESSITPSIQIKGQSVDKISVEEKMKMHNVVNLSIAVIKDGKIRWAKGYGTADGVERKVDENTLFQAASISKPVAAAGIHKLVQKGALDLDTDVNKYLSSWKVPSSRFTDLEKVTLRKLMTHTAGTTVHGFPGYQSSDAFPTDIQVLNGEGNTDAVVVDTIPGSINRYSGGGYTIMERVVEDVTGKDFAVFMSNDILDPFGMGNSTYEQPLPQDKVDRASFAFGESGEVYKGNYHHYPEQAAAGLWTTPSDLAKFLIGIQEAYDGKSDKVLNKEMTEVFLTRDPLGHGHGPGISGEGEDFAFGHGGKNAGFTCNMFASAKKGYGMIIMSGSDGARPVIDAVQRAIAEHYGWEWEQPEVIEIVVISNDQLQNYSGKYLYRPASITASVDVDNEKLKVTIPSGDVYFFHHLGDHLFIDVSDGTRLQFNMDASGKCIGLTQNGRIQLEKIE
ncbi:MAG: beta-lactamase family protein [Saprospiraceae bacterium]|nr:beta-lactamase family protein [Saprospiraceae bacterium]